MNILVTGGDGFIGSHLVDYLDNQGHEVNILDNHSTSTMNRSKKDQYVTDEEDVIPMVENADFVFHLAHTVGVSWVKENLWWTIYSGAHSASVIADACFYYDVPFLYASSSEVYGSDGQHSFPRYSENSRLVYPISKLVGELLVRTSEFNNWRIARIFNTIGPRQLPDYGMVVPTFIRAALQNKPLCVHGDGSQKRWFAHVEDTVEQLVCMMNSSGGIVWDVGDTMECTILELARMIVRLCNSKSEIVTVETPFGKSYGDLYRVEPNVQSQGRDLEDVLEETIEWWIENRRVWED